MTCEVRNKEINSQCAEFLVRPLYIPYTQNKAIDEWEWRYDLVDDM